MRKIISSSIVAVALASGSLYAKESAVNVGYTSASIDGVSKSGASLGYGAYFGTTFKQAIGFDVAFLGSKNEADQDNGNIGNIYYNLGYEVLPQVVAYGSVGYGFQSLGSTGSGDNKTSAYAAGITTGVGIRYDISDSFSLDANYKNYALSYQSLDYDIKTTTVSLVYKFGKK